ALMPALARTGQSLPDVRVAPPGPRSRELGLRLAALESPAVDARRGTREREGGDAVTAALKTATLATGKPGVVAFDGGYHGLSHGPLAACGLRPTFREPFADQLNPHVEFAPYPRDRASLAATMVFVESALAKGDVGC